MRDGKIWLGTISLTKYGAVNQYTNGFTSFWRCEVEEQGASVIPIDVTIEPYIQNVNDINFEEGNG